MATNEHNFFSLSDYFSNYYLYKTQGATSASYSFIRNLIKYSKFFTGYYFLVDFPSLVPQYEVFIKSMNLKEELENRCKVVTIYGLDDFFDEHDISIMHHWDPNCTKSLILRDNFGTKKNYPLVNLVHAIAPPHMYETFVMDIIGPTRPYDSFICPSIALRDAMIKYFDEISFYFKDRFGTDIRYKGKFEVIPLGIDEEYFYPMDKKEAKEKIKVPIEKTIVGCITRLTPVNKMDLFPLIKAFKDAVDTSKNKDVILMIAGKEQCQDYIEELQASASKIGILDKLIIKSEFDNKDIPLYYNASDMFVSIPDNVQETFGLTPIEAMMCKVPVIVSDWDGYKETVEDSITGFKVPMLWGACTANADRKAILHNIVPTLLYLGQSVALDNHRLADCMRQMIENPSLREHLGENAMKQAIDKYSWSKIIPKLDSYFQQLYEEASKDTTEYELKNKYGNIPYYKIFDHYSTYLLNDKTMIKATRSGILQIKNAEILNFGLIQSYFDFELAEEIINLANDWINLAEIESRLSSIEPVRLYFMALHMIKHDLLEFKH